MALAFNRSGSLCTAQELATKIGIAHSMVRDVLVRLTSAGVLRALPNAATMRQPVVLGKREP